eukprot:GILI01002171.1.p1 GENE.GILI01002171.1~~GILI01002171.1.p1  ORF type:complete len:362 (+),score=128.29 GILI01002171.1:38-1087(+)
MTDFSAVEGFNRILVTGGCGYIGSHTCVELVNLGYEVTIVDNLVNSSPRVLERVNEITGKPEKIEFVKADINDEAALDRIFSAKPYHAVIHFAALKAVGESMTMPLEYYQNNVTGTLILLQVMKRHNCRNIIFSSSATVYGDPASIPVTEASAIQPTNPYGQTKAFIERILMDVGNSEPGKWNIILLRYFNPVGAHVSGRIGESPKAPNNLMPYVQQVAIGIKPFLNVFGNDWPTPDGTGVRDYIHVVDLALGHVASVNQLRKSCGTEIFNLGTGTGLSVLEMIRTFSEISGREVPYKVAPRRPGDIALLYADTSKAEQGLGWRATRGVRDMCADAWRWQSNNPNGYDE